MGLLILTRAAARPTEPKGSFKHELRRKADPDADYWFGFEASVISDYRERFADDFNLILAGAKEDELDFFVFPYEDVRHLLTNETITEHDGGRRRWIGSIRDHVLHVSRAAPLPPGTGQCIGRNGGHPTKSRHFYKGVFLLEIPYSLGLFG